MKISFVEIKNFRKLKSCRVEIADKETIFVGANNSGKTSAIDALMLFLKQERRKDISSTDFTLTNWIELNNLGNDWFAEEDPKNVNLDLDVWYEIAPSLDVWLSATDDDLHRVSHIIPTLDWTTDSLLGVRLAFVPKEVEKLYTDYLTAFSSARSAESASTRGGPRNLNSAVSGFPA